MFTDQRGDFVHPDFCCFLQEPFEAVCIFSRCYSKVQPVIPAFVIFLPFNYFYGNLIAMYVYNTGFEKSPPAIGQVHNITITQTQNLSAMPGFFLIKGIDTGNYIRCVK
jgi:hypothetical protein